MLSQKMEQAEKEVKLNTDMTETLIDHFYQVSDGTYEMKGIFQGKKPPKKRNLFNQQLIDKSQNSSGGNRNKH